MITYEKKQFGARMPVSKEMEKDTEFDVKKWVSNRLVSILEHEAEKVQGFIDYTSITIERDEQSRGESYQHFLSRDEQPLWRFVLGLLPLVARASEERELPPMIEYRARAIVGVPVEETT